MEITYLLPALLISTIVYWIGLWLTNAILREEDEPKKSFRGSLQKLFSDQQMHWVDRWILAENLIAIVLGLSFLTIVFYKFWLYDGAPFDVDNYQLYIPHSLLIFLSLLCSIPLAIWVFRLFQLFLLLTTFDMSNADVHWLKWFLGFFSKEKKKGCLYSILRFLHFFILCIQFLFSFALSYTVLSMLFSY